MARARVVPVDWQAVRDLWEWADLGFVDAAALAAERDGFAAPSRQAAYSRARNEDWERISAASHARLVPTWPATERELLKRQRVESAVMAEAVARTLEMLGTDSSAPEARLARQPVLAALTAIHRAQRVGWRDAYR